MTTIKILPRYLLVPDPKSARCKVKVSVMTFDNGRGRNRKLGTACASFAKIVLNGTPMCLRHAQQAALNIIIQDAML